mgnify:CR=1 FL=1
MYVNTATCVLKVSAVGDGTRPHPLTVTRMAIIVDVLDDCVRNEDQNKFSATRTARTLLTRLFETTTIFQEK